MVQYEMTLSNSLAVYNKLRIVTFAFLSPGPRRISIEKC